MPFKRSCFIAHGFVDKQEPYMEGVNPFIKNNKHRMIMFLDELGVSFAGQTPVMLECFGASVYVPCSQNVPDLPEVTEHFRTDLSRDLAALHEVCVAHSDELRTLSNGRGAQQVRNGRDAAPPPPPPGLTWVFSVQHVLKKLLAITELLQQKQAQYAMSNSNR